jgi:hypothetical protein
MKVHAFAVALALAPLALNGSLILDQDAVERVGFSAHGLKICHQNEWRNLSIDLSYLAEAGSPAANTDLVCARVRTFLEEYSSPNDFWEIMNTNLIRSLLKDFPGLTAIESTLSLAPDRTLHFPRQSIVRFEKDKSPCLKESFNFTKLNYLICQESFRELNLHIAWDLKENPGHFDYPDYLWVDAAMEEYFASHPVSFTKWVQLKPALEDFLLERFPTLASIRVDIIVIS